MSTQRQTETPSQSSRKELAQGNAGSQPQKSFSFARLDAEMGLAQALYAKTGRDLFAGVTAPADRQAAARIAILINRLEGEFGAAYQRIYGEALPERKRIEQPKNTKGNGNGHNHES